jgi:hypothetical protein
MDGEVFGRGVVTPFKTRVDILEGRFDIGLVGLDAFDGVHGDHQQAETDQQYHADRQDKDTLHEETFHGPAALELNRKKSSRSAQRQQGVYAREGRVL